MSGNSVICTSCGESKSLYKPLFAKGQKGLEILESYVSKSTGIGTRKLVTVVCHSCGYKREYDEN